MGGVMNEVGMDFGGGGVRGIKKWDDCLRGGDVFRSRAGQEFRLSVQAPATRCPRDAYPARRWSGANRQHDERGPDLKHLTPWRHVSCVEDNICNHRKA